MLCTTVAIEWHLRELMFHKNLTNKEVAEQVNSLTGRAHHVNTISRWKLAKEMPKLDGKDLQALLDVLGCSRDDLLGKE